MVDLSDRSLRGIVIGLGVPKSGVQRENGFNITVASEIMAILCLSNSLKDLKLRLAHIVIDYTYQREAVFVRDLHIEAVLILLLKDAIKPNLVQTTENTPTIIHGGPFVELRPSRGAGFIVVLTGKEQTLPGIPTKPAALNMDITKNKEIMGLF